MRHLGFPPSISVIVLDVTAWRVRELGIALATPNAALQEDARDLSARLWLSSLERQASLEPAR